MDKRFIDLTGQRFNGLVVKEFVERRNKHSMFRCICDCGGEIITTSNNLRRNHTTSCGCKSSKKTVGERSITHNLSKHPLFFSWLGMKNRCYWKGHNRYKHYGGKGVVVCDEWRNDFKAFYDWAIINGWSKGLSIDRINNDGNYEPNNCRFLTNKEQSRNRSTNVRITINGVTKTQIEWSEATGIKCATIAKRLKRGLTPEEAIFGKNNSTNYFDKKP